MILITDIFDRMANRLRPENGVVLPLVIIGLAIGAVSVVAVLRFTGTALIVGSEDTDNILALYAAQAGISDAITDLIQGVDALDPTYSFATSTINDLEVDVTVTAPITSTEPPVLAQYFDPGAAFGLESLASQESYYFKVENVVANSKVRINWAFTPPSQRWKIRLHEGDGPPGAPTPVDIAADDFESGTFEGGTGWAFDWFPSGEASVATSSEPFEGSFHMRLTGPDGFVKRAVDLSTIADVRLQFWAKVDSLEFGETVTLAVSPNDIDFTVVRLWQDGEDDNLYRFEDIDLSGFATSTEFWIAFSVNASGVGDQFFVDDLKVVTQAISPPIAESSDTKGPGALLVDGSLIEGGTYTFEFFNDSGVAFVSAAFDVLGSEDDTWIYAKAHKDY
ncbi:MAG: pilus assembly PilX N-terminal domain-containing protein, partial [Chloroflexi bacterium]|nr:pilus assembly PilX N-terminal domain-containing protein [Chloroflexota bacterium]